MVVIRNFATCCMAFVCTALCWIPAIICVAYGVNLLSTENTRFSRVTAYNDDVDGYLTHVKPVIARTNATLANSSSNVRSPLARLDYRVTVAGNHLHLKHPSVDTLLWESQGQTLGDPTNVTVSFAASNDVGQGTVSFAAAPTREVVESLTCSCVDSTTTSTTTGKGGTTGHTTTSNDRCSCSQSAKRQTCESSHVDALYTEEASNMCYSGRVCGECRWMQRLTEACFVVRLAIMSSETREWKGSSLRSCMYPFTDTSHLYEDINRADATDEAIEDLRVPFYIREETDPFVTLQTHTQGSNQFGLTAAEQEDLGLRFLVVGCCLLGVAICIGGVCCYRNVRRSDHQQRDLDRGSADDDGSHAESNNGRRWVDPAGGRNRAGDSPRRLGAHNTGYIPPAGLMGGGDHELVSTDPFLSPSKRGYPPR